MLATSILAFEHTAPGELIKAIAAILRANASRAIASREQSIAEIPKGNQLMWPASR